MVVCVWRRRALFYQLSLRFFSNLESFCLTPAPLIAELAQLGMEAQSFAGDARAESEVGWAALQRARRCCCVTTLGCPGHRGNAT